MLDASKQEIKLFYCYAREDKALRKELETNLSGLKRQYHLINWSDCEILPGEPWEQAIDTHLNTADVILLLISPHFLASDYCYSKEMQRALERHQAGDCCVIPILLRPTFWEDTPFSGIQVLPTHAIPVTSWHDRYEAFHDVVKGINNSLKSLLLSRKTKEEWFEEGDDLSYLELSVEEALAKDQTKRKRHNNVPTPGQALLKSSEEWWFEGFKHHAARRYEEALDACEQAIRLDPKDPHAYEGLGRVYMGLGREMKGHECYRQALDAYEQAIHLNPKDAGLYIDMGPCLEGSEERERPNGLMKKLTSFHLEEAKSLSLRKS